MILVLGATGTTGGEVARQLIAAGHQPRLLVRDPDKAKALAYDAELARGDLGDAESLRAAMRGVERVYLVSSGGALVQLEGNVIDAARASGVRHVVKLSVLGADAPAIFFARAHAESERRLRESGLAWTMLRPGNFMTNTLGWAETIRTQGVFSQPTGEGRWAAVDPADIGAVAVRALTEPGHEGEAYPLTGPEALSAAGYAVVLAEVLGRAVRFVDVPPEAAREGMLGAGTPPAYADGLLELMAAMKADAFAEVADGVPRVLGRPAASYAEWARRHRAAFA